MPNSSRQGRLRIGRPSPAMIVALLALVMSTAGTATAAVVISNSSQIKNGAVKSADIANNSLTTSDIKAGTITGSDIKAGAISGSNVKDGTITLDKLAANAKSQSGALSATEVFRKTGPVDVPQGTVRRVATARDVPPGVYAIFAKTTLTGKPPQANLLAPGDSNGGHCVLDAGGEKDDARTIIGGPGLNAPGSLDLQLTKTFTAPGEVGLDCDVSESTWQATDTSIILLRVGAAPRQSVDG